MLSARRALRVAVVGAGPSGFYAADHLLRETRCLFEVDLYDRLPTPWGLVRGGVAPDHPRIKSVTRVFEKTAGHERFRFFGNVEVGTDIDHGELMQWYDAVVYAVGTARDRRAGIPGEDLPGSLSATEFVGWYNGHPDYADLVVDLSGERALVIGNGNVAIDVARVLILTGDELAATDIADHALDALKASKVREVIVVGRRGPQQASFTTPELLELGELSDADVAVDPGDLEGPPDAGDSMLGTIARRKLEILQGYAHRPPRDKRKRVVLRFLTSPVEFRGNGRVEEVRVRRNDLVLDATGALQAKATDHEELIEARIVVHAIGYTGSPVPGVPFEPRRGLIPNEAGRIIGEDAAPVRGAYVTGWIKRGPSGVIGTNKKCARETIDSLIADAVAGRMDTSANPRDREHLAADLRVRIPDLVDYGGWEAIDTHERGRGLSSGRPRVKLTRVSELVATARSTTIPK